MIFKDNWNLTKLSSIISKYECRRNIKHGIFSNFKKCDWLEAKVDK
jgi:hypothetical protein